MSEKPKKRPPFNMPRFQYSDRDAMRIIRWGDFNGLRLYVVGDPDNGCYEWVACEGWRVVKHSDSAYGSREAAMEEAIWETA